MYLVVREIGGRGRREQKPEDRGLEESFLTGIKN